MSSLSISAGEGTGAGGGLWRWWLAENEEFDKGDENDDDGELA